MAVNCGIVGLPNVGKSTLFNALTRAGAVVANYPFCTVDPNVGMVPVPDERMTVLANLYQPKKVTPTHIEVVDIAGLVAGASQGEGLGNQFLGHVREVDALIHLVRCFDDSEIVHVNGAVDPGLDVGIIGTELILKDIESLEKRIIRAQKQAKTGEKEATRALPLLQRVMEALSAGSAVRNIPMTEAEAGLLKEINLLTAKPLLYVANVPEQDVQKGNAYAAQVVQMASQEKTECLMISGKIEEEIAALSPEEQVAFLSDLGLSEPGLSRLARAIYRLLGLVTFFTVGEDEVKAWPIRQGTRAVEAAGKIHSDIQRGFIRAEIFRYADLMKHGSARALKEEGLLRLEGKEYVVEDGDCVYFRFHV